MQRLTEIVNIYKTPLSKRARQDWNQANQEYGRGLFPWCVLKREATKRNRRKQRKPLAREEVMIMWFYSNRKNSSYVI